MIYDPPPLWLVVKIDTPGTYKAREMSPAQAALTVAARHNTVGRHGVTDAASRTARYEYQVYTKDRLWCAERRL